MRSRGKVSMIGATVACLALAACGTPPWEQNNTAATPVPTEISVTATPTPTAKPVKVRNDLAKGSAKHQLGAGGVKISVNYWSTLDLRQWTSAATKPLNLSMSASFNDGSKQNIYLRSLTLTTDVRGPEEALTSPEPITDSAPVTPGYLVKAPSSYVKVFQIPEVEAGATQLTLNLTYDLLAQSAPKSKEYLSQSASDTLVIPLAP